MACPACCGTGIDFGDVRHVAPSVNRSQHVGRAAAWLDKEFSPHASGDTGC
jgi:hypothetical protein